VLFQDGEQRLGLLRAEVDALKICDLHVSWGLLLQRAEDQKKIPHIYPHLHAVGVVFAIVFAIREFDIRLCRSGHSSSVIRICAREIWCERRDSNSYGLPRQILSLVRLP